MSADLSLSPTDRTRLHRLRERGRTDRADLYAVLDAGLICHLGVTIDGSPVVLPTAYGHDVCVTVTHLDGMVCARSVFHHSMNYRSAVVFGTARLVTDDTDKLAALRAVTEQLVPGRWENARPPTRKELAATAVLALPLDEASVKARTGPPKDDPEDYQLDFWAGVVPAAIGFGPAEPDP